MERILAFFKKIIPGRMRIAVRSPYHFLWAFFGALVCGFPSRKLTIIGVTGTKGKTTTVEFLHSIFTEAGFQTASLSSLRFKTKEEEMTNELKMTMPGRFFIQKFLRRAARAGCTHIVLEVTSQGIEQFRHRFIRFRACVLTNVAPEHIEAHGSFEKYLRAKLDLFWRLPQNAVAVINHDDALRARFSAATRAHTAWYGASGIRVNGEEWGVSRMHAGKGGVQCDLSFRARGRERADVLLFSPLRGQFNAYNMLAATAAAFAIHIPMETIAVGVRRVLGIPGRMEFIQRKPFKVVVDYAHTPDSLRNVYAFLKESTTNKKLICVLGSAGGGRDRWKRPEMGRVAAEFCDEIILANEDPYDENPEDILEEIASGFPPSSILHPPSSKIIDRREAIHAAFQKAKKGDTIVITGKGAEPWIMGPNGAKIPWDDREVARKELKKTSFSSMIKNG